MTERSDIAPQTLHVSLEPEGVEVEYLDGRSVFYHGVPRKRGGSVVCPPGREVHVLVTSPEETEGVMVYVNDRTTHDEILESTGVGRVILEREEGTSLFPGVEVTNHGYRIEVRADPEIARGRVFVFAEDQTGETSYELVSPGDDTNGSDGGATGDGSIGGR
ncbi:MAG: DUF5796 family protein [Halobacteriota archaeon]|uniref:DUF5796 family protein n=1 Tax=Natronomonas sp. TaxID=2184060 RepID=UPI003976FB4B